MCKDCFSRTSAAYSVIVGVALFATLIASSTIAQAQSRAAIGCAPVKLSPDQPVSFEKLACDCFNKCDVTPAPGFKDAPSRDIRAFRIFEGRDIDGKDYKTLRGVNYEQCTNACKADGHCSSFSFDKWNRWCYLKDTVPSEIRIEPNSIVAVNSKASPAVSRSPLKIEKFRNARFYDEPFQRINNSSYERCLSSCDATAKCEVFTFEKSSNVCKLIANPSEYTRRSDIDADSGVKRQLPLTESRTLGATISR